MQAIRGTSRRRLLLALLLVAWIAVGFRYRDSAGIGGVYSPGLFALLLLLTFAGLAWVYLDRATDDIERRGRRIRVIIAAVAATLAIALLELPALLGWVDYRAVLATDGVSEIFNPRIRLDREFIGIHNPHDRFAGRARGDLVHRLHLPTDTWYDVDVKYDRNGFRNPTEIESAEVVLLGDSFLEAALIPQDQVVGSLLAVQTGRTVLNLGHSGFGPQQELHALRRFGFPVRPRVVFWFFYEGNDLQNYRDYEAITTHWDDWLSREHGFFRRSAMRNFFVAVAMHTSRPQRDEGLAARRAGKTRSGDGRAGGQTIYLDYYVPPLTRETTSQLDGAWQVIETAAKECQEKNIKFALVFVPTKWRVYHELVEFDPKADMAQWRLNEIPQLLESRSAAAGVPFIDLTAPLSKAAASETLVYLPDDAHWTAAGHRVVADGLKQFLAEFP